MSNSVSQEFRSEILMIILWLREKEKKNRKFENSKSREIYLSTLVESALPFIHWMIKHKNNAKGKHFDRILWVEKENIRLVQFSEEKKQKM